MQPGEATIVSRRGICDRGIWTKPLALAADAGELWGLLGCLRVRGGDYMPGAGFRRWQCWINRAEWADVAGVGDGRKGLIRAGRRGGTH